MRILFFLLLGFSCCCTTMQKQKEWKLNTSNAGKLQEFQRLFAQYGYTLSATDIDLKEVDADPVTVVVHKASQMGEHILIEDTSLEVEGADVGINVRWLLDHLPKFIGHNAEWKVLLAYRQGEQVYVYEGVVNGTITSPQGEGGFGFDPVFLPEGRSETLAQSKPDAVNARALAVKALMEENPVTIRPIITSWEGPWQK